MGQVCSSKEEERDLERYAREDATGKRRLSIITLPPGKQTKSTDVQPPTVTAQFHRELAPPLPNLDIFAMSCAGTYAPQSYKENQDDFFVLPSFASPPPSSNESGMLVCVMDGHGVAGRQASQAVNRALTEAMKGAAEGFHRDPQGVITSAFRTAHTQLSQNPRIDSSCSGTTCVMSYVGPTHIITGNAGDSRAVLGKRKADGTVGHVDLSLDHKPELPEEKKRIVSQGGRVEPMKGPFMEHIGPARVWVGREMYPGLAMSRSIGDVIAQSVGVSHEPEFIEYEIDYSEDFCIVLASDGVWEFITSQEAIDIIAQHTTAENAASALVRESLARWAQEEEVCDDITAVVIYLQRSPSPAKEEPAEAGSQDVGMDASEETEANATLISS